MRAIDVAVIGGGPGGAAAARSISVAAPNLKLKLFERARKLERVGFTIALMGNGLGAVQAIDPECFNKLDQQLLPDGPFARFGKDGQTQVKGPSVLAAFKHARVAFVPWFQVQQTLMQSLPSGVCELDSCLSSMEQTEAGVVLHFRNKDPVLAKVVIGCDGVHSTVRQHCFNDGPPHFLGRAVWRGQAPAPEGWPYMENLSSWFNDGKGGSLHITNLRDGFLAWTFSCLWKEEDADQLGGRQQDYSSASPESVEHPNASKLKRCLEALGTGWPDPVMGLLHSTSPSTVTEHAGRFREAHECTVWGKGPVSLLGDAAHAYTPLLAQGTNQTLEDAVELGRAIAKLGPTEAALREYEAVRKPRAQLVHAASVELAKIINTGQLVNEAQWHDEHREIITHVPEPLVPAAAAV